MEVLTVLLLILVLKTEIPDAIMRQGQNFRVFLVLSGVAVVSALIVAIGLFAVAELLTCFMAIEANTRQGANAVVNLQSVVRTSTEEQTELLSKNFLARTVVQNASVGSCPKCGQTFRVTENLRGQKVSCPKCNAQFVV